MPIAGNPMVRMSGLARRDPWMTSAVRWTLNNIHAMAKSKLFIHWKATV